MNEGRIHDWIRYVKENAQSVEPHAVDSQSAPAPDVPMPDVTVPKERAAPSKNGKRRKSASAQIEVLDAKSPEHAAPQHGTPMTKQRVRQRIETRAEMLDRLMNPVISLHEASVILNVCAATVRRYAADELLPHERTKGGQRRFRLRAVLALSRQLGGKRRS